LHVNGDEAAFLVRLTIITGDITPGSTAST
jgi:hypothetical protein